MSDRKRVDRQRGIAMTCEYCGTNFKVPACSLKSGNPRFCSRVCYYAGTRAQSERHCIECGVAFREYDSVVKKGGGKYCSMACKYAAEARIRTTGETRKCAICGKDFYAKHSSLSHARYCSERCRGLGQRDRVRLTCDTCGIQFDEYSGDAQRWTRHYCSRSCKVAAHIGSTNPNWRGGIDPKEKRRAMAAQSDATLTDEQWTNLLSWYGNKCAYCGRDDTRMTKDHVVPVSQGGAYTLENIVPACQSCNSKKHSRTPAEAGMRFLNYVCVTFN